MPSFLTSFAMPALALAGSALANPVTRGDACLAAVTGKAALGDENLRSFHCSSFIKTIVTPAAITVTTTITDAPAPSGKPRKFKRDVTVCPNDVPNYASACDLDGYKSACKVFGISSETTYTIPATTTTKTVYAGKGGFGSCTGGTATTTSTVTSTVTVATGSGVTFTGGNGHFTGTGAVTTTTVTVTAPGKDSVSTVTVTKESHASTTSGSSPVGPSGIAKCVTKERADALIAGFIDLLEYTSYAGDNKTGTPPGRGYHYNVSADVLDPSFSDYSDSINWMAGFKLGDVTFATKAAFDYGQGVLQAEVKVEALNVWYGCNTVTWRWLLTPPTRAEVRGINHMVLNADNTKILTNYAEFDNAAWLSSFGLSCKVPK